MVVVMARTVKNRRKKNRRTKTVKQIGGGNATQTDVISAFKTYIDSIKKGTTDVKQNLQRLLHVIRDHYPQKLSNTEETEITKLKASIDFLTKIQKSEIAFL